MTAHRRGELAACHAGRLIPLGRAGWLPSQAKPSQAASQAASQASWSNACAVSAVTAARLAACATGVIALTSLPTPSQPPSLRQPPLRRLNVRADAPRRDAVAGRDVPLAYTWQWLCSTTSPLPLLAVWLGALLTNASLAHPARRLSPFAVAAPALVSNGISTGACEPRLRRVRTAARSPGGSHCRRRQLSLRH